MTILSHKFQTAFFASLLFALTSCGGPPKGWPAGIEDVRIPASDAATQPALFYAPAPAEPVPLLVGLHTWSGKYTSYGQGYGIQWATHCIDQGWAFIHPQFRGPNNTPDACGSDRAIADILEAIDYAKSRRAIDPDRIYLVGVSGGGHMAMMMAARHPEIWAGVSAWCGISDLSAWHAECKTSGRKYAGDMEKACGGTPESAAAEFAKRSPLTYLRDAKALPPLDIQVGIFDGHKGSVPVSHSLHAFNAVVPESTRLTDVEIARFRRDSTRPDSLPAAGPDLDYGAMAPLFRRQSGLTRLTVFNGGHVGIAAPALNWLSSQLPRRLSAAYDAQDRSTPLEQVSGYKIAFAGPGSQKKWGVPEPISGRLLRSQQTESGVAIPFAEFATPLVEAEIAFVMKNASEIASVHGAFDIPNIPANPTAADVIRLNGCAHRYILGPAHDPSKVDMLALTLRMTHDDNLVYSGKGDPRIGLNWLIAHLASRGMSLRAGDVVLTGAVAAPYKGAPGTYVADCGTLGSISFRLEAK
ncbi:MAG: 2-keto-4-pentenoate hydratase/dienelactone hydrolase [Rhodothermales bacterium]|jgi:2-keto-4-pentenoate hydratase/dienelactone hydrolase